MSESRQQHSPLSKIWCIKVAHQSAIVLQPSIHIVSINIISFLFFNIIKFQLSLLRQFNSTIFPSTHHSPHQAQGRSLNLHPATNQPISSATSSPSLPPHFYSQAQGRSFERSKRRRNKFLIQQTDQPTTEAMSPWPLLPEGSLRCRRCAITILLLLRTFGTARKTSPRPLRQVLVVLVG